MQLSGLVGPCHIGVHKGKMGVAGCFNDSLDVAWFIHVNPLNPISQTCGKGLQASLPLPAMAIFMLHSHVRDRGGRRTQQAIQLSTYMVQHTSVGKSLYGIAGLIFGL